MSRQGLKRLGCVDGCGCIAYMTLAQLERYGCPVCVCGGLLAPEDLEVAAAVLPRDVLEGLPVWAEYVQACRSVEHGQASHVQRGREVRDRDTVALERVRAAAAHDARQRRLSGLVQFTMAAVAAEEVPF